MPVTPTHNLPWPEGTDPATVPSDLEALARKVALELDDVKPGQITGLTSGQILVANSSGTVVGVAMSGDATVTPAGLVKIGEGKVSTTELAAKAVATAKLDDGAVSESKLANGAVTNTKLGSESVSGGKLVPYTVSEYRLDTDAVTARIIKDGEVKNDHLAYQTIEGSKIKPGTITRPRLADNAVETSKIKDGAVNGSKIGGLAISQDKIWTGAVTRRALGPTIQTARITTNAIQGIKTITWPTAFANAFYSLASGANGQGGSSWTVTFTSKAAGSVRVNWDGFPSGSSHIDVIAIAA